MLLEMRLYGYIVLYFRQHVARYVDRMKVIFIVFLL